MNESKRSKESGFYERLKKEVPSWIEKGWIHKEQSEILLAEYLPIQKQSERIPMIFGTLGALLIGLGAIAFFAANWDVISKLSKLLVLFTSLGLSYGVFYYFRKKSPVLSESFLFLSTLLFGANIFLIAQMYNIQAQYPYGVLVWTLSTLWIAYWMNSIPSFILAIVLSSIWTSWTHQVDGMIHWSYLLLWLTFVPWIYSKIHSEIDTINENKWIKYSGYVLLLALFFWNILIFSVLFQDIILQYQGLQNQEKEASLSFFEMLLSYILVLSLLPSLLLRSFQNKLQIFSFRIETFMFTLLLLLLFVFTFSDSLDIFFKTGWPTTKFPSLPYGYWTLAFLVVYFLGLVFLRIKAYKNQISNFFIPSIRDVFFLVVVIFIVFPYIVQNFIAVAILNNALFLFLSVSLIYFSFRKRNKDMLNLGYISFGLLVVFRYFDTLESLVHQSLFFVLGGILVLVLGFLLERSRRKLLKTMDRHVL